MSKIINDNLKTKFIEMYIMGMKMTDIAKELKIDRSTAYTWRDREDVKEEIELLRKEIRDAGVEFVKGRYLDYLQNVDKLCRDFSDKRTSLSSNIFMIEKLDGKATTKIEMKEEKVELSEDEIKTQIAKLEALENTEENTEE